MSNPCEADERDILVYNIQLRNLGLPEEKTAREAIDALESFVKNRDSSSTV